MYFKCLLCHACHPWYFQKYTTHSSDDEKAKAVQKFPGFLLHMLREYSTVKEGIVANGNCLWDGYIVALIDQNLL